MLEICIQTAPDVFEQHGFEPNWDNVKNPISIHLNNGEQKENFQCPEQGFLFMFNVGYAVFTGQKTKALFVGYYDESDHSIFTYKVLEDGSMYVDNYMDGIVRQMYRSKSPILKRPST